MALLTVPNLNAGMIPGSCHKGTKHIVNISDKGQRGWEKNKAMYPRNDSRLL